MATQKEKRAIAQHFRHYYRIRVRADETVEAQERPGGPWGLLYRSWETERHLKAIGLR